MAEQGANVVVSDINLDDCQKVVMEIETQGRNGLAIKCDVSSRDDVESMVKATLERFGKLDILVNNAARADFKPFLRLRDEDWDMAMDANLKGQFLCSQAAAKAMIKNKWGRIINIASISSGIGNAFPPGCTLNNDEVGLIFKE